MWLHLTASYHTACMLPSYTYGPDLIPLSQDLMTHESVVLLGSSTQDCKKYYITK